MRAITLTQPWASLVAAGEKRIETRSWQTSYRGPLAIHAAKGFPLEDRRLCTSEPFAAALRRAGFGGLALIDPASGMPRGVFIAVCNLSAVISTNAVNMRNPPSHAAPHEEAFGNYAPGRFAWVLEDVAALPEPLAARGALGLWTPGETVRAALDAVAPPWVPLEDRP